MEIRQPKEITLIHVALLATLCVVVYSNTIHFPFVFDDAPNITDNPVIREIENIPAMFVEIKGQSGQRPVMLATFAVNYALGGSDPTGYHIFNIALHCINSILLYLLVRMILPHCGFNPGDAALAALLGAGLFAAHPVQTESVTYTVSRSQLLFAMFYLAGMITFIRASHERGRTSYSSALLFALSLFGMGSRESFITYPVALVLLDYFIVSRRNLREMRAHIALYVYAAAPAMYLAYLVASNDYQGMAGFGVEYISPLQYLMTQFHVHGTYLRLLILPIRQNVDYDYAISNGRLLDPATIGAMIGYACIWGMGFLLAARGRSSAAFAVIFFLLVLLPDSSIIPLQDVIFEHRVYLASAAFFCLVSGLLIHSAKTRPARTATVVLLAILILAYGSAAYARNLVWQSPVALWSDAKSKSPQKARPHNNLAIAYKNLGQLDLAVTELERTVELIPGNSIARSNLGAAYNAMGMTEKAISELTHAVGLDPSNQIALYNLGRAYGKSGDTEKEIECYERALALGPNPLLEGLNEKIEKLRGR